MHAVSLTFPAEEKDFSLFPLLWDSSHVLKIFHSFQENNICSFLFTFTICRTLMERNDPKCAEIACKIHRKYIRFLIYVIFSAKFQSEFT